MFKLMQQWAELTTFIISVAFLLEEHKKRDKLLSSVWWILGLEKIISINSYTATTLPVSHICDMLMQQFHRYLTGPVTKHFSCNMSWFRGLQLAIRWSFTWCLWWLNVICSDPSLSLWMTDNWCQPASLHLHHRQITGCNALWRTPEGSRRAKWLNKA